MCELPAEKLPKSSVHLKCEFSSLLLRVNLAFVKQGHLAQSLHMTDNEKGNLKGQTPHPRSAGAAAAHRAQLRGRMRTQVSSFLRDLLERQCLNRSVQIVTYETKLGEGVGVEEEHLGVWETLLQQHCCLYTTDKPWH